MREEINIGLAWEHDILCEIRRKVIFDPNNSFTTDNNSAFDEFVDEVQKLLDNENRTIIPGVNKLDIIIIECDRSEKIDDILTLGVLGLMKVCENNGMSLLVRIANLSPLYNSKLSKREIYFKLV